MAMFLMLLAANHREGRLNGKSQYDIQEGKHGWLKE